MPISCTTNQNNGAFLRRFSLSQIASDLRFAIRITNRNRSQIARFGALSPEPFPRTLSRSFRVSDWGGSFCNRNRLGPAKTYILRGTPRTYAIKTQAVTDN